MSIDRDFAAAIEAGDGACVERLLRERPALANADGWTPPPLHCAVLWNQPAIAALLLDHEADIEKRDPDRQTTPLRYAIMYAKVELVRLFLTRGADAGRLDPNGTSALELARDAAAGRFAEYDDLPDVAMYESVVAALEEHDTDTDTDSTR